VRFLIDKNLSPRTCTSLIAGGHGATHVRDHGMASATDSQVLAKAAADGLVLIAAVRGDFGRELALSRAVGPSVILLLLANLTPAVASGLGTRRSSCSSRQQYARGTFCYVEHDR
jgi:predicted nuclease of predicted toxin-antitoxin system